MVVYRHRQIGWVNVGLWTAVVFLVPLISRVASSGATLLISIVALVAMLMVSVLTVTIDQTHVDIRMGIGLIRRRIALADVKSARAVRNRWWYGWGVRLIPGGIMYNIYGLSAVEVVLANGSRVRVGTDEPEALERALWEAGAGRPDAEGSTDGT